jgi:4'-phosphopantetheinyl transferase
MNAMDCETAYDNLSQLSRLDVHLWIAELNRPAEEIARRREILARDELERASAFKFDRDRAQFVAARSILRQLLGLYTKCAPQSIQIDYNQWGKPALATENSLAGIRFNLSHSHGLAVYAIASGRDVGVDVEMIRADLANEHIAEHFFSPTEVQTLRTLPFEHQARAFFACWTRKEAYIKALGRGMTIDLASFDVSVRPEDHPAIVRGADAARWSLVEFQPRPGYLATLAVEGNGYRIAEPQWI